MLAGMIESLTGCRQVESGESDEDDDEEGDPYLLPITHEVSFEGALKPICTQAYSQLATEIGTFRFLLSQQKQNHPSLHYRARKFAVEQPCPKVGMCYVMTREF